MNLTGTLGEFWSLGEYDESSVYKTLQMSELWITALCHQLWMLWNPHFWHGSIFMLSTTVKD